MCPLFRLSDDELDAVIAAARPTSVERAGGCKLCHELGPCVVYRAIVKAQRAHFDPPDLSRGNEVRKYR